MELPYLLFVVLRLDRAALEHVLGAFNQAFLPVLDLIGMHVELLGQLSQGALAFHCRQRHLGLEGRSMITSFPAGHLLLLLFREL